MSSMIIPTPTIKVIFVNAHEAEKKTGNERSAEPRLSNHLFLRPRSSIDPSLFSTTHFALADPTLSLSLSLFIVSKKLRMMLSMNLSLPPPVTISKSSRHSPPINAHPLLSRCGHAPSLLLSCSPLLGSNGDGGAPVLGIGSGYPGSGRIWSYPFGFSSRPSSQIRDPSSKTSPLERTVSLHRGFGSRAGSIVPRAASEASPEGEAEEAGAAVSKRSRTLQLAVVFGFWYFQNVVFNIYNKKALNVFPYPWFLASFQLFVGSIWMFVLWSLKLQPRPKISKPFIVALLGPALFHTVGHISACVSFSKVAVSFTHVIKSAEPVFSVVFSSFLGDSYPLAVWLSILPIVFGCSLAAITEVSFNFGGLWGAMISNVGFVLRNIYSKKSLQNFKEVNGLNLYGWISIISLFYLFPVAVFVEGSQWVQGYHKAIEAVGKPSTFYFWVLLSGVFYHLYNQSSYQALDDISPLTFSVGNTMKRVVVIVSTVLVFRNPVRPLNALGSAIAILGTFLYSQATSAKKAKNQGGEKKS